jgi:hypothetical protein
MLQLSDDADDWLKHRQGVKKQNILQLKEKRKHTELGSEMSIGLCELS